MTTALIILAVFGVLLGAYAVIMWATGDNGPVSIMRFWDEGQGR